MKNFPSILPRWLLALSMLTVIFLLSSQPGHSLPDFLSWDYVVKKSAHFFGYGLLALSFFYWLRYDKKYYRLAWLLAVFYAVTDEFHQSFVAGRNSSAFDVIIFDNFGAAFALWLHFMVRSKYEKKIYKT